MTAPSSPSAATDRPGLELLAAPGTTAAVRPLVAALARWYRPHAPDGGRPRPAARLATSLHAPGVPAALEDPDGPPLAIWVDGPHEAMGTTADDVRPPAAWLVPTGPASGDAVTEAAPGGDGGGEGGAPGGTVVLVPRLGLDLTAIRPVPPFLRARWRSLLDLPDELVVAVGVAGAPVIDAEAVDTALAAAAAVAASGPAMLDALALGAPVVTDRDTAAWLGDGDGSAFVVAGPGRLLDEARALAADLTRASLLGRAGRRFVEQRHDLGECARRVAAALGHPAARRRGAIWPPDRPAHELATLHTPLTSLPARRVLAAMAALGDRPPDRAGTTALEPSEVT